MTTKWRVLTGLVVVLTLVPAANAQVEDPPINPTGPYITEFVAVQLPDNIWRFQGTVLYDDPADLTMVIAGVVPVTYGTVNSDGTFSITIQLDPSIRGVVTAQCYTSGGVLSNEAWDYLAG